MDRLQISSKWKKIRNSDRDSSGRKYSEHCNGYAENSEEDDRISEEESLWKSYVLPLDAVKGKEFARKEILLEPGVIGAANQLVIYDEVYKDLFASLLGQILVVKDMDVGIKIANKYHHSVRIVTLDGDSLNRGGAMSGGAFKNKSNLLGRSREVEELKKKLDRWTKAITEDEEKYHENEKNSKNISKI